MKITRGEPTPRKMRGRDLVEQERELSPWEEVNVWREKCKPKIIDRAKSIKGSWQYFLDGRYAYDLYPELQHELQLGPDDWERLPNQMDNLGRPFTYREVLAGAAHFFPHRRVHIGLHQQHLMRDIQYEPTSGVGALRRAQFLIWMDWRIPADQTEFKKDLARSEQEALSELRGEGEKGRWDIESLVNGAADVLLSFPAHRPELQRLVQFRWDEARAHVEFLSQDDMGSYHLPRFLRNLRVIFADDVRVDKYGRVEIFPPAKGLGGQRPLPERSEIT